jgi:hypothetical protein
LPPLSTTSEAALEPVAIVSRMAPARKSRSCAPDQPSRCLGRADLLTPSQARPAARNSPSASGHCGRSTQGALTQSRPDHLLRHMRSHNNEKPFTCKICDKAFGRQCVLKPAAVECGLTPRQGRPYPSHPRTRTQGRHPPRTSTGRFRHSGLEVRPRCLEHRQQRRPTAARRSRCASG